ncbi:hypothetical protein H634G_10517 [Metarhizium anisopliae BRIP 53293]|uniref:Uncharacterized protein n=1 Tax=Metarhizium anisopliae BRIP 53293 TaxID=1291518 RepID=A0A0D9NJU9_METAN|nr:hypothetical protein H634G_10517 [Metarhizium anisopliae BRIP 53293]KJK88515.1 hypothetical protein H633G_07616 [Metarhizium anisopliae BRIP 53284]
MVRIATVTLVAFATSAFASSHIRIRGGPRVELARRTPAGEDTAAKQQAQMLRDYAKQLEQYAEQLEKGGGTETGNGQPPPNIPSGNGTETGNKPPIPSRRRSSPLYPSAGDYPTGDVLRKDMKTPILLQAFSGHAFVEKGAVHASLDVSATVRAFDKRIHELTGFRLEGLTPMSLAKNITVLTLFAQVCKDALVEF